ncbi:hypothetical protein GCM10028790_38140 [Micromonospora taraxaci]|uniref:Uncharacterized protein n=2 Tax=Micromonospora taraxaci TaxID=1316803 RepID=A0A561VTW2_9ACTN|nr:hypothetical protein FHU34_11342 [Micromonospora taraxaci]
MVAVDGSGNTAGATRIGRLPDMTVKRSVSLPDDVAQWLDQQPNVSAAITAAVRVQMARVHLDEVLRRAGIEATEAGRARWRERLSTPIPAEALAEGRRMLGRAG